MSSSIYMVVGTEFGTSSYQAETNNFKSHSYTTTTFKFVVTWMEPYNNNSINWIAVGKQCLQWGSTTSINGGDTISFPLAFSNSTYSITGSTYDSLLIYCPKFSDKTKTSCIMHNGIGHVSYSGNSYLDWIAVGK